MTAMGSRKTRLRPCLFDCLAFARVQCIKKNQSLLVNGVQNAAKPEPSRVELSEAPCPDSVPYGTAARARGRG